MSHDLKRLSSSIATAPSDRPAKQPSLSPHSKPLIPGEQRQKTPQKTYFAETYFADMQHWSDEEEDNEVYSQYHEYTFASPSMSPPHNQTDTSHLSRASPPTSFTPLNAVGEFTPSGPMTVNGFDVADPVVDTSNENQNADQGVVMGVDLELSSMSEETPEAKHADKWEQATIALSEFHMSHLCNEVPSSQTGARYGYLKHITVSVDIWVNYDSRLKRFFQDPRRVKDCGKPYLSPKQRARLEKFDWVDFETGNLLLNIGTPFRTLFHVWLSSMSPGGTVSFRATAQGNEAGDVSGEHKALRWFVEHRVKDIEEKEDWEGENGFTLKDIDDVASNFVFEPASESEAHWYCFD